jgi:hypothetical protein
LKLGLTVSQATVSKYMLNFKWRIGSPKSGQSHGYQTQSTAGSAEGINGVLVRIGLHGCVLPSAPARDWDYPPRWVANEGIRALDFVRLAKVEGLKSVETPARILTSQQVEDLLRNNGPIWCAGDLDGVGHVVVLTGIDGQTVFINDPNPAKKARIETLAWFNEKLARVPNCMMYMPA